MAGLYDTLATVHWTTLQAFIWTPDTETWRAPEYWARPLPGPDGMLHGDCEDFALECHARLLVQDVPRADMRLAICRASLSTARGVQDHCVLAVHDSDDVSMAWVLDNRQRRPERLRDLSYDAWALQKRGGSIAERWEVLG